MPFQFLVGRLVICFNNLIVSNGITLLHTSGAWHQFSSNEVSVYLPVIWALISFFTPFSALAINLFQPLFL